MIPIGNIKAKRRNNPNKPKPPLYSRGRWLASQGTLIKKKKPNSRKLRRKKNKELKVWMKLRGFFGRIKTHDQSDPSMICLMEFKPHWQAVKAQAQA